MDIKKILQKAKSSLILGLIMFFDDIIVKSLVQLSVLLQLGWNDYEVVAFFASLVTTVIIAIFFVERKEKNVMITFYAIMFDVFLKFAYVICALSEIEIILYSLAMYVYCVLSMLALCIVHKASCSFEPERESLPNYISTKSLANSLSISCVFSLIIALLWTLNSYFVIGYKQKDSITLVVVYALVNIALFSGIYLISTRTKINKSIFLFSCGTASACVVAALWKMLGIDNIETLCFVYAVAILIFVIINASKMLYKKAQQLE